ncbi:MAG: lysophospholipid acyltransferase family protein [Bacteroidales bacterium]|nr:lysophospholipid acyltransferase family protein [Bacteroidales bacterium]
MKKFFDYIGYLAFRMLIFSVRITPFPILYFWSDVISFIIFRVIRYRRKVINTNLTMCFPEKTEEEKKEIRKKFYRHFTDLLLESFKGYALPVEKLAARYPYENKELTEKLYKEGKSMLVAFSHYGNWEWATQTVVYEHSHHMAVLYKPMKNRYIDNYIKTCREHRGTHLCPIDKTKYMFAMREKQPMGFVMLGDQNPSNTKRGFWVNFMGIDTCVLHGIEMYSKMFNLPVIYLESRKVKRGHYQQYISMLVEDPEKCAPGEISALYMHKLEESLKRDPAYWLWTHKRWKHKRDENGKAIGSEYYK